MKDGNMKTVFCIIGIFLAIIITIGLAAFSKAFIGKTTGQKNSNNSNRIGKTETARMDEAREKLSKKYNKNFVIKQVYSQKLGQKYYEVDAYPEGEPDVLFTASIDTNDSFFSDNYVLRHICKQISNEIYTNLGIEANEYNTYIFIDSTPVQPITDDLEQSIRDYANLDPYNKFVANIFVTYETDKLYDKDVLFSNLEYLDISANIYTVDKSQFQEVKEYLLNYGRTKTLEYMRLVENFTSRTI